MSFGVTDNGYVVKTLAVINDEAEQDLALVIDPQTGEALQANLSDPSDIVSQMISIALEGVADGVLVDQAAYNQFDPGKATEDALSSLVQINGITRKPPTASTVLLDFTGTPDAVIPAGVQVSALNSAVLWLVSNEFTLSVGGTATGVPAICQTLGSQFANTGTLTALVSAPATIDTVINAADAVQGNDEETDNLLRRRRDLSTYAPSIGLVGSLDAALKDIPDVVFSRVYQNLTLAIDANGLDPKSVGCVVFGGSDEDITKALVQRTSIGPTFSGNVSIQYIDNLGILYNIKFYRPAQLTIAVEINLTLTTPSDFPDNGVDLIKQAIVDYSTGGARALGITSGFNDDGFPPGEDILLSRLYTPINSVAGHTITNLQLAIDPAPVAPMDIAVAFNEVGVFSTSNITIVVV